MKLGIIIQARQGSTRLPHKIVLPFYGEETLLDIIISKLKKLNVPIVLATTHTDEDLELKELIEHIDAAITEFQPKKIIILDLHTTSATGGIFTIVSEDAESLKIATELYAPVVKGLIKGVGGSTLHYFKTDNMGIPTTAIAFEAGQHDDPRSVQRTIAWLIHSFRAIGSIQAEDMLYREDEILRGYSKGLPKVVKLIGVHKIRQEDSFKMEPDYQNFQRVRKGEILAYDKNGAIHAPEDCLILMPLYQPQGNDGFFLVKDSYQL